MTLGKQMIEQLRLLAAGEAALAQLPTDGERFTLAISGQPNQAALEFLDHDRYSVTLRALDVSRGAPVVGDARTYLSAAAAAIARQLSYLEEPLAVCVGAGQRRAAGAAALVAAAARWRGDLVLGGDVVGQRAARRANHALSLGTGYDRARGTGLPGDLCAGRAPSR
jgi:hypothetical protein